MKELIPEKHDDKGTTSTRRNLKEDTIDEILVNEGLNISSVGYLPLNHRINSNHRLIWVSITHTEAFGDARLPLSVPAARKLKINQPRGQEKYL